jgi:hypothetical protein
MCHSGRDALAEQRKTMRKQSQTSGGGEQPLYFKGLLLCLVGSGASGLTKNQTKAADAMETI